MRQQPLQQVHLRLEVRAVLENVLQSGARPLHHLREHLTRRSIAVPHESQVRGRIGPRQTVRRDIRERGILDARAAGERHEVSSRRGARLRGGNPRPVEAVPGERRPADPRPPGAHVRADGQVHRLQEGPRDPGAPRGRGLHLVRSRGADPLDRALRPRQGRDARAVRVDQDPRRGARRAPPPRLGAALAAPLRARDRRARSQFTALHGRRSTSEELADALAVTPKALRTSSTSSRSAMSAR